jgi:hypothetical protein
MHQRSKSSSPANAAIEDVDRHPELEEPHRTPAFEAVKVEVAIDGRASTGAASQLHQFLDLSSPLTTAVAREELSPIQPTSIHNSRNQSCILKGEEGQA